MNNQERKRLGRLYDVLNSISGLGPTNPMDMGGVASALKRATRASGHLLYALDAIGHGEFAEADIDLTKAEIAAGMRDKDGRQL